MDRDALCTMRSMSAGQGGTCLRSLVRRACTKLPFCFCLNFYPLALQQDVSFSLDQSPRLRVPRSTMASAHDSSLTRGNMIILGALWAESAKPPQYPRFRPSTSSLEHPIVDAARAPALVAGAKWRCDRGLTSRRNNFPRPSPQKKRFGDGRRALSSRARSQNITSALFTLFGIVALHTVSPHRALEMSRTLANLTRWQRLLINR